MIHPIIPTVAVLLIFLSLAMDCLLLISAWTLPILHHHHHAHGVTIVTRQPASVPATKLFSTTTTTTSSNNNKKDAPVDVKSLLYLEHEKMLVGRGQLEEDLMKDHTEGLAANVVKGTGAGGGFSASSKKTTKQLKEEGKAHAAVLRQQGVVRIDNVLPEALADEVRAFVMDLRKDSETRVANGELKSKERFADVLLKENRCDLTMPMVSKDGITATALASVIQQSPVGETIASILGKDAVLYEFSCLISSPGSQRQVMHPDTPCAPSGSNDDPVLYTCFVALQDITMDMGPTTWLPGTHTLEAHDIFGNEATKDELLQKGPAVLGLLPKGCCAIFDSRVLHAGTANKGIPSDDNDKLRAVFYCSFRNPKVPNAGNPGSIRPNLINKWDLQSLDKELKKHVKIASKGKDLSTSPFVSSSAE